MRLPAFPSPPAESEAIAALRHEVRDFLHETLAGFPAQERARSWAGYDTDFSRKLGERGWIGMTWPRQYGGGERSALERYVVIEEMLAAGAPVAAHWIADRQSGPTLLRFGTEAQKRDVLPKVAAGECYFCIGMSEAEAGSDLAAVRTTARAVPGGFVIDGTKLWTTYAHRSHYMILFARTDAQSERQAGTSQFQIDLSTPGIRISPIDNLAGEQDFNEVHFEEVFVPETALIGKLGDGWHQVTSELALERSGPERFLSSFPLLDEAVRVLGSLKGKEAAVPVGRLSTHLMVLRHLSRSVATILARGGDAALAAALVKDLGATFEQEVPEILRLVLAIEPHADGEPVAAALAHTILYAPAFSLRGGTREILRGIIARGMGLR